MGARYYAGDTGRFTSQDPVALALGDWKTVQDKTGDRLGFYLQNPQTHNSYSYTANNPLKYVDKNGEYISLKWPEWVKEQRVSWHGVDYMYHKSIDLHEQVTDYCETLMGVDDSIGAILDYLESSNQSDESLLIYMGDNGFSWGEHGLIDKRHFYEESTRVPLLFHYPAVIKPGQVNRSLILRTIFQDNDQGESDYIPD